MFGGSWGGFAGSDDHLTKERDPPPRPIELEFPEYVPPLQNRALTRELSSGIQRKICQTRTFTAISDSDLEQLNIDFKPNVPLSSLVPADAFSSRPYLYDDDLQSMIDEISVENRDAFREVLRLQPLEGRKKPRLAYARNLFSSLENISRYYDTAHDQYYQVPISKAEADANESDEAATEGDQEVHNGTKEVYKGYRLSNAEAMIPGSRIVMIKNLLKMVMHKFQCRDHEPVPQPREKLTIRGVKLQSIQYHFCVARIPQEVKQARARLVEGPIMAAQSRDELRFKVKDRLFTPEKTAFVGERFDLLREVGCMIILAMQRSRQPQDPEQKSVTPDPWWVGKTRWGGGPTKWGQLASEVYDDEDPSLSPSERTLREEKQKKEEAEKLKSEEVNSIKEADALRIDDLIANTIKPQPGDPVNDWNPRRKKARNSSSETIEMKDGRRLMYVPPARRKWYKEWQQLRPNSSGHDTKIISRRIGNEMENTSGFDEVYLLSSCNHHVAISKMRVHKDYLEWLETGKPVPSSRTDDKDRPDVLVVRRSSWYDMFDVESRKEFLTELWRLMCWINRNEVPQVEFEKMREKRKSMTDQKGGQEGDMNTVPHESS